MIDKNRLYRNLNEGILEERLFAFERNLDKNLALIKEFKGLERIICGFMDKNIIIVGAGPSLGSNINVLKKIQNRGDIRIISTDMAFLPLMNRGIRPGYVISCETNPVDFFGNVDSTNMHLMAFSCMSNINLRKWKGNISFYNWLLDGPEYGRLWEKAGRGLGFVATGSIVTTQAAAFALGCNVKSVMLVGNDLGFRDRYYVDRSIYQNNYMLKLNRLNLYQTVEMNISRKKREYEINRAEEKFFTHSQFLAAKIWLEELFQKVNIPVYDCGIPGCSGKFVNRISLKEYAALFDRKRKRKRK